MKQRKIITWVLVLAMILSLFTVTAFADEPEAGDSPSAPEETEESAELEESGEPVEDEAKESAEPEAGTKEPIESTEQTEPEEETVSEEPALLLGSADNGGMALASDDYVAYIGTQGYETLADAVTAANDATADVTIQLVANATISAQQTFSNTSAAITLDLNGYNITGSVNDYMLVVSNGTTLTITDSTQNQAGIISNSDSVIKNYGTLNMKGGTISTTSRGIWNYDGTVNVSGGTISATGTNGIAIYNGYNNLTNSKLYITGGKLTAGNFGIWNNGGSIVMSSGEVYGISRGVTISNSSTASVSISGGSISGGSSGIGCTTQGIVPAVTVSGGTVTGGTYAGLYLYNADVTITGGTITSTSSNGVELSGGSFTMSGGEITGAMYGVYLCSLLYVSGGTGYGADITATITGGEISGLVGVFAGDYNSAGTCTYTTTLTIGDANGGPTITGSTSYRGLSVEYGAEVTVLNGTISGGHGIRVVEESTDNPTKLTISGDAVISATNTSGEAVYNENGTNGDDMIITISKGTYNTQVASGYLDSNVTQITYIDNGMMLYYVDTPTAQAERIEAVIADAEQDTTVNTVEITVTDGDLTLTDISTATTDVHINSTSSGTVTVNGTLTAGSTIVHVLTRYAAKDATCTEDGYTGDWVCTVCNATVEAGEIIPATGHSTVLQNAKDATCTEAGYTGDLVCTVCNTTVESGEVIPATGHTAVLQNAKDATCTEDGYTGDLVCTVCNATVEAGETIPATGHSYEAVFTWSEDGTSAVLGLTCAACGDVQTAAATVTSEVKTAATETENGVTVYTAAVTFNGVTYTATKELADIPATGEATEPPAESAAPSASPTATATANTAPTTGDGASPLLWALLAAVCAAGFGAVLALGRKEKAER